MSHLNSSIRGILVVLGVVAVLYAVWWVPLIVMAALSFRWRAWEVPLLGLMIDFLWLPTTGLFIPVPFFMLFGLTIVWIVEPLRRQLLLS